MEKINTKRGRLPTWAIVLLSIVGVIVVLVIAGFVFLGFVVKPSLDDARDKGQNASLAAKLSSAVMELELFYEDNGLKYPTNLAELNSSSIDASMLMYAYSADQQKYHLGVKLSDSSSVALANDADFDSLTAGYINGFSGADPVFDRKSYEVEQ